MPETEEYIEEEELIEEAEAQIETAHTFEHEEPQQAASVSHAAAEVSAGLQAILDSVGGEPQDWELVSSSESGYFFDGENVLGPDGAIWTNEDTALHQEMLAQWREGESAIFRLPDYREESEDGETLYVTELILGETGEVTYEIHKHETTYPREEESVREEEEKEENDSGKDFYTLEEVFGQSPLELAEEISHYEEASAAASVENRDEEPQDDDKPIDERDMRFESLVEKARVQASHKAPDSWLTELLSPGEDQEAPRVETHATERGADRVPVTAAVEAKQNESKFAENGEKASAVELRSPLSRALGMQLPIAAAAVAQHASAAVAQSFAREGIVMERIQ